MNFSSFASARAAAVVGMACGIAALTGCQGEKNVAHIGAASITEQVFNDRTQHIMQADMLPILDAGGSTLTRMILEEAVGQLAKEKSVEPTAEAVKAFTNYQVRVDPNKRRAIEQGVVTAADFEPTVRYNMESFALGVDGAKAKSEDVQKEYDDLKSKPAVSPANPMTGQQAQGNPVKIPAELTIRLVGAKDEATATKILAQLKTNDDFKAAATTAGMTGPALDSAGQETPISPDQIDALKQKQPDIYNAISQTAAGQYVAKPITVANPKDPKAAKNYLVVKVIKNTPETVFTIDEARPVLEQIVLGGQKPDANEHQSTLLNERLKKMLTDGSIQINIDRYKNITTKVIPLLLEESDKAMKARIAQKKQMDDMRAQQAQMQQNAPKGGAAPKGGIAPAPTPAPKPNGKP